MSEHISFINLWIAKQEYFSNVFSLVEDKTIYIWSFTAGSSEKASSEVWFERFLLAWGDDPIVEKRLRPKLGGPSGL